MIDDNIEAWIGVFVVVQVVIDLGFVVVLSRIITTMGEHGIRFKSYD